ncbi:FIGNL1-interacting regulator of recombination and mitosis-like [Achroia grisella]|uniref:FIGNL1-interacting regulator of recombination and mitosis-like n=1 Tax=Achroia grisella TaxID=688607 RepID=UPI0027D2B5B9|nr:FIGNL1-interacting regulator of recombination and mitosis-like [Achroia grisella]
MDLVTYESLVTNTKAALADNIQKDERNSTFYKHLTSLLEDCVMCITQTFDMAVDLLLDPNVRISKLIDYISNAAWIIQMLSKFLKKVVDSVSMSCCSVKIFPTATGHILLNVFMHCKDSESIYGRNLVNVETELKDLFRACHELQLTYLMILEKHFVFNLNEAEEQDILLEALHMNLEIGNIVQSLDVKTMAEQWKGFIVVCEKYSNNLMDKNIYNDCTKILCAMATNNMSTAIDIEQDEKVIVRSLKVASFTIKILLKVTNIFKYATFKECDHIVDLMVYIYLHTESYLELMATKSLQFSHLFRSNVLNPADSLLKEILLDEVFMNCIFHYNVNIIKEDDKLLGFIILLIAIMKIFLENPQKYAFSKYQLLIRVFDVVSQCHVWFNIGLKFERVNNCNNRQLTYGLYEYLLTHTTAFMMTLNQEDTNFVKRYMYNILLSTDCYCSLFASNIWFLISRIHNHQLDDVVVLCRVYQKLESNVLFPNTPQQVHLSYIIGRLFETMSNDDKLKLYTQFSPILDKTNLSLWTTLRIENLPVDLQYRTLEEVTDKCKLLLDVLFEGCVQTQAEIFTLAQLMKLTATGSGITDVSMKDYILNSWAKGCPNHNVIFLKDLDNSRIWYLKYIEALTLLTISVKSLILDSQDVMMILHVVACICQNGYTEIKLLLSELSCILTNNIVQDEHKHNIDCLLVEIFKYLFQDTNANVRNKLLRILSKYNHHPNMEEIMALIISENHSIAEIWSYFVEHQTSKNHEYYSLKQQLLSTKDFKYSHICSHNDENTPHSVCKTTSGNFEFADIDTFFNESDAEPVSKKVKLYANEVEDIVNRLEMDTTSLCKLTENISDFEQKRRIENICNKLKSLTG